MGRADHLGLRRQDPRRRAPVRQTKPALLEWGCAIEHTPKCIQTIRAVSMLPALTGNIDVPGGWVFGMHGLGRFPSLIENLTPEANAKRLGADRFKLLGGEGADLPAAHIPTLLKAMREGKPYPVKAFLVFGNNTLTDLRQHVDVYDALMKLDFMVCADLFMTPTAELADIVLPAASWPELERTRAVADGCRQCRGRQPAGGADRRMQIGRGDVRRTGAAHEASGRHRIGRGRARRAACRRRPRHDLRRDQAEGLLQGPVQVPQIRERRLQDADRQDRALFDALREDGLRAAALLRRAAGKPDQHAGDRRGISRWC